MYYQHRETQRLRTRMKFILLLPVFLAIVIANVYVQVNKKEPKGMKATAILACDAIEVDGKKRVRLIGVDCKKETLRQKEVQARENLDLYSNTIIAIEGEAEELLKKLVLGQRIRLEYDKKKVDKDGYELAYVFKDKKRLLLLPPSDQCYLNVEGKNTMLVNGTMLLSGYGVRTITYPNQEYSPIFDELIEEAKEKKRGIWKRQKQ